MLMPCMRHTQAGARPKIEVRQDGRRVIDVRDRQREWDDRRRELAKRQIDATDDPSMATLPQSATPRLRMRAIIADVAREHGLSLRDILNDDRRTHVLQARRQALRAVIGAYPNLSLPQLGRIFGGRDHTSIMNDLGRLNRASLTGQGSAHDTRNA